jgi:hypothetical protein
VAPRPSRESARVADLAMGTFLLGERGLPSEEFAARAQPLTSAKTPCSG